MDDLQTLETCLSVSSFFEGSNFSPRYDNITGNFDGAGLSLGCLQWAAGPGSLSHLLSKCLQNMDASTANGYLSSFGQNVITNMAKMSGDQAKNYVLANFIEPNNKIKTSAAACWKAFLLDQNVVNTQRQLAKDEILAKANTLVSSFTPGQEDNLRAVSFFFDIVVQSGGMKNNRGHVDPISMDQASSYTNAISEAQTQNKQWVATQWQTVTDQDELAKWLLHYAFERAQLSLPQWQWNTLARRGTIATRYGFVNGTKIDLTDKLP
jgi:hypothetical protein